MKISKIILAIAITSTLMISSCRDTKKEATDDHGHEHNADGTHMNEEKVEQEEFQVETDSMEMKKETHTHDNGSEHHNH
ncbi:hypothetical protein BXY75_1653 [Ulvibacter antarcticus]|uniref:Uncharacterized protein n=2 Tax=Ulvibacter antarcticus TaxID=442714 RepID=A0A3L9ZDM9_9FLAO|nr:hypothetical protein BXY75_1653 [Ulvibacter antarcticus]